MTAAILAASLAVCALAIGIEVRAPGKLHPGRVAAAIIMAAMLAVIGLRPMRAVRGDEAITLDTDSRGGRSYASVEALLATNPNGAVTVRGDGLDSATATLLHGRGMRWNPPAASLGLIELHWPRQAVVGERITISGMLDGSDSARVSLAHPDGHRDSLRASGAFTFRIVPRAAGRWTWVLGVSGRSDTIGIDVRSASGPKIQLVEARPSGEGASLGRMIEMQGGWLLQRTRLTAQDVRIARYGAAPGGGSLTGERLAALDAVILGSGALGVLTATERTALSRAVDDGLGVVHLIDSLVGTSDVQPFTVRRAQGAERVRVVVDGVSSAAAVPVAPVNLSGGQVFLGGAAAEPLAWRSGVGRGVVVATRLTLPSRLALAGDGPTEQAWWSALLGAAMRPPIAEWRIRDDVPARMDHPLTVERIGAQQNTFAMLEGAVPADTIEPVRTSDSLRTMLVLWPRRTGWLLLADGDDTLGIHVVSSNAFESLDAAARRAAMVGAERPAGTGNPSLPVRRAAMSLWWAWAMFIGALAMLWRRR